MGETKTKQHLRLSERTLDNDIKYRGPLSFRYIRIVGWVLLAISQVAVVLGLFASYYTKAGNEIATRYTTWSNTLNTVGSAAIALFSVAHFGLILKNSEHPGKTVLGHLIAFVAIYLIFLLFYKRYLLAPFKLMYHADAEAMMDSFIRRFFSKFLSFNVFVDLLMCSSTYYFLTYTPKKVFTGKKLVIFRLFALLPFLYEIAAYVVSGLSNALGLFTLPIAIYPLLPTKPILTYAVFLAIIVFIKLRKRIYTKRGHSEEEYDNFLKTNANSLDFSRFIAISFLVAGLIDLIIAVVYSGVSLVNYSKTVGADADYNAYLVNTIMPYLNDWGIGKTTDLILGAPIVMLFSYTKEHNPSSKMFDVFLPIAGIVLCLFVYLEGFYAYLGIMEAATTIV